MSKTVPPIPPLSGTNPGNVGTSTRVDTIQNDNTNNTGTNNVTLNVVDFSSWKDRFLVYLDGLEPYLLEILENGPVVPKSPLSTSTNILPKPQKQWSLEGRQLANQDKRLKNIIISSYEGPSDIIDTKIAALRLKFNAFKALEGEKVQVTFTRLENLLNDLENKGPTILSKMIAWLLFLENITMRKDSDSDVEEDTRKSGEFLANLNDEFQDKSLLANQKRFYKRSRRVGGKYKALKSEVAILTKKIDAMSMNKSEKGLVVDSFDWDEESLSSKDEGVTRVKAFMAIVEDEIVMGKADDTAQTYSI
ncbi:hypothetical protein Tco_0370048 [Tanacetum coccineum]